MLIINVFGWIGMIGLALFYWWLGSGKVLRAYVFGTIGAAAWLVVGVLSHFGYHGELPSLIAMEAMVIVMNVRGIMMWRKSRDQKC